MDGGLRNPLHIPADSGPCVEVTTSGGVAVADDGGQHHFRSMRGSGQQVLAASDNAAAVAVVDETGAHNLATLSNKALSLGLTARAILQAHNAADSSAGS